MKTMRIEVDADGVALLTIDVSDRPMNVITPEFQQDFAEALQQLQGDAAIKGLVITSGKGNGFVAGADLKDLVTAYGRDTPVQAYGFSAGLSGLFRKLETSGKPVAVAINGLALGGGLELCLSCHYRVLADDPKAVVGLPEVKVGLLPGAGGTQRLPRLIGIAAALPLLLEGTPVAPAQALKLGIVHALAPADQLLARAREWVLANPAAVQPWDVKGYQVPGGAGCTAPHAMNSFQHGTARLARSTARNFPAPLAIASCVFEGTITPIDTGLRIESKYFAKLLTGPVARNLMRTLFVNKGAADKLSQRPANVPKSRVAKLGVLGAGMMGAGLAYSAAASGAEVVLLDTTQAHADKGKAYSANILAKDIDKGRSTQDKADALLARITPTTDYALLAGCDLVIEAVFENRDIKREVTQKAAAVLGPDAIFASNTSTLPITGLATAYPRPERFIGMHFFSPVEKMPLIEIICGKQTGDEALAKAFDFAAQLRKTPILVNDSPAFVTSRLIGRFIDEGLAMVAEGVAPALIENAAKLAGYPVGPLTIFDETSADLQLSIHSQAVADKLPKSFHRLAGIAVVHKMMDLGRNGRRVGAGFYDYPPPGQGRKTLWNGLQDLYPRAARQPDVEELKQRFLSVQAVDAARIFEEGVVNHPADVDLGSIIGIGYPAWTGGALSYIETVGLADFVATCDRFAKRHGSRFKVPEGLRQRAASGQGIYTDIAA